MRLGFALPQFGPLGAPEAIVTVAKNAEDFGFDSLWVADRILWPVNNCPRPFKAKSEYMFRHHKPRLAGYELGGSA
jgi:alkanesulfonate monooxygenase SsuD/methylene tetrahydromethanopterin reductase-like flavin-dependent oxidoreductase (luciferase family)